MKKIDLTSRKGMLKAGCYAEHYIGCWGHGLALGLFFRMLFEPLFKKGGAWQVLGTVLYFLCTFPLVILTSEWKCAKLKKNISDIEDDEFDDD